jgi:hypothetical protein
MLYGIIMQNNIVHSKIILRSKRESMLLTITEFRKIPSIIFCPNGRRKCSDRKASRLGYYVLFSFKLLASNHKQLYLFHWFHCIT